MKCLLNFLGIPKNYVSIYNTIKNPHWYVVQVSDTTMMTRAA